VEEIKDTIHEAEEEISTIVRAITKQNPYSILKSRGYQYTNQYEKCHCSENTDFNLAGLDHSELQSIIVYRFFNYPVPRIP